MSEMEAAIIRTVRAALPEVQAIYLFGSYGTGDEWPDSDVDLALLLPPLQAKQLGPLLLHPVCSDLQQLTGKPVDLINARQIPTVLQKEIVMADRRIACADTYAADEFEMLVLSYYQKLNQERAGIVCQGLADGRFLNL